MSLETNEPLKRDPKDPKSIHLNVGDILESGQEPYPIIMRCLQDLKSGECLLLHVPFAPNPLLLQLERMGFHFHLDKENPDSYLLRITR